MVMLLVSYAGKTSGFLRGGAFGANRCYVLAHGAPGWYKIFNFVRANSFSQKFRPKQQESDTREGIGNLGIEYVVYTFIFSYKMKIKKSAIQNVDYF